MNYKDW